MKRDFYRRRRLSGFNRLYRLPLTRRRSQGQRMKHLKLNCSLVTPKTLEDFATLFFPSAPRGRACALDIMLLLREKEQSIFDVYRVLGKPSKLLGGKYYYTHIERVWNLLEEAKVIEAKPTPHGEVFRLSRRFGEWLGEVSSNWIRLLKAEGDSHS